MTSTSFEKVGISILYNTYYILAMSLACNHFCNLWDFLIRHRIFNIIFPLEIGYNTQFFRKGSISLWCERAFTVITTDSHYSTLCTKWQEIYNGKGMNHNTHRNIFEVSRQKRKRILFHFEKWSSRLLRDKMEYFVSKHRESE